MAPSERIGDSIGSCHEVTEGEKMKPYNKENIPLAKELRRNMTPWERKLWYLFLKEYPIRFQRQKSIGNFIADFYCARVGLVIELDGRGHYEEDKQIQDRQRTEALENMKLTVVRIKNTDVDQKFREVCEYIDFAVRKKLEKQG